MMVIDLYTTAVSTVSFDLAAWWSVRFGKRLLLFQYFFLVLFLLQLASLELLNEHLV